MEVHRGLIEMMDDSLRPKLMKALEKEQSLAAKVIRAMMHNPEITSSQLRKQFSLKENMLNKTLTQVKNLLWDFHAAHIRTSYDDIFVLRQMLLSGKVKNAGKFFNALRKEYEWKQQWDKIDCLYTEGLRYAQITGDEQMAQKLSAGRKENMSRLHEYTTVYADIITEMIRLEGHALRQADKTTYESYIRQLFEQARKTNHHLLIHNGLHIQYLYYTRYRNDPAEVFRIISAIKNNAEENKERMADITYAIALNNFVNFLTLYRGFGSPEPYVRPLKKVIHHGGSIAISNFYYSLLEYYIFNGQPEEARRWMDEYRELTDESKFSQYRYATAALLDFAENDFKNFQENIRRFYGDPSYLHFPDMEITLRILEIIFCMARKESWLAASKLESLRMFISRNIEKDRCHDERRMVSLLSRMNDGKTDGKEEMEQLENTAYRNIHFLLIMARRQLMPGDRQNG